MSKDSRAGAYVIRTRKPHAVLGLPFIGRHFGYVGQSTRSFAVRIGEHLRGGGRYGAVPKCWSDLEPRVYYIGLPRWTWLQRMVEQLLIWVLCPVYNVKGQGTWNIRRIPPYRAERQRRDRDANGGIGMRGIVGRWVIYVCVIAAGIYVWRNR